VSARGFPLARVPESLLGPIVEALLDRLGHADTTEVPLALRNVIGFDRRARSTGGVRRQVARSLDADQALADTAAAALVALPAVAAAARVHDAAAPVDAVMLAAARGDLDVHVAALWATAPDGAEVGLGAAAAIVQLDKVVTDLEAERDTVQRRAESEAESARRAEAALALERAKVDRVQGELRDERAARRGREESAAAQLDAQKRRADVAEVRADDECTRADAAEARVRDQGASLEQLRTELKSARAELETERAKNADAIEAELVRRFAGRVHELADALAGIAGPAPIDTSSQRPSPRVDSAERGAPPGAPTVPARRPLPPVPPGLDASSVPGLVGMLGTPSVVLVVDGYNVAFAGWPDASAADKRELLARGLVELHHRTGAEILCVFDGDGTVAKPLRREGVRVVFSAAGEEADAVVVRSVRELPRDRPVVVVSSDRWVAEHAEAAGARVVGAPSLVEALRSRRTPARR
jgi:predicted RNA-binding protein with PIN domain